LIPLMSHCCDLSTISAHGRALKLVCENITFEMISLSTISAHGRALKPHSL